MVLAACHHENKQTPARCKILKYWHNFAPCLGAQQTWLCLCLRLGPRRCPPRASRVLQHAAYGCWGMLQFLVQGIRPEPRAGIVQTNVNVLSTVCKALKYGRQFIMQHHTCSTQVQLHRSDANQDERETCLSGVTGGDKRSASAESVVYLGYWILVLSYNKGHVLRLCIISLTIAKFNASQKRPKTSS